MPPGSDAEPPAGLDPDSDIALIGMAGRFPGAETTQRLWDLLVDGREGISRFETGELDVQPNPDSPDATPCFVAAKGVLEGADRFDAAFFGYYPREAALMDPQHRLFLECAWHALEDAACDPHRFPGAIGVFAGCYIDTYLLANICNSPVRLQRLIESIQIGSLETELGNDKDYLATRVSYKLNLRGPSITLQTACSTSLVAIAQACQSLQTFQSDVALAGAATITFPQKRGYFHREGGMLSPDGRCRPFDAAAQGTVFSNGVGVVVLKRLGDALADRDHVYGVIRGSACNNDGSDKVSYTAPSVDGQAEVIALAQEIAEVDPRSISYVECHGTATPLGDPIEIAGLTKAFRRKTEDRGYCAVGSMKGNLGHLDCAAGVAAVMKVALALENETLPASINFETPNPKIDFDSSPFYVNQQTRPWPRESSPRRAGVSSFGVGGTNAHLIIEEAPPQPASPEDGLRLLPLSAKTEDALKAMAGGLSRHLESTPLVLSDVSFTLRTGRSEFSHRTFVVAAKRQEAAETLAQRAEAAAVAAADGPGVVFLFPGQGAQYPGMAGELYREQPYFRAQIDRCLDILAEQEQLDLRPLVFAGAAGEGAALDAETLGRTIYAQPAIFSIEYALARLWQHWGVEPDCMVGHSVGEFAAACVAGVFSLEDALKLVCARGRHMDEMPAGAMLSVRAAAGTIEPLLGSNLDLAAENSPDLSVVAGSLGAIEALEQELASREIQARRLHTSHAFHSRMMDAAVEPTVAIARSIPAAEPRIPIVSTLTGERLTGCEATDPEYWGRHLRRTVRFSRAVLAAAQDDAPVFLEVGPGQALTTLARQCLRGRKPNCVPSLGHPNERRGDLRPLLEAAGALWCAGVPVDLSAIDLEGRRVSLPGYPFQRKRHWIEPEAAERPRPAAGEARGAHSPASGGPHEAPAEAATAAVGADPVETVISQQLGVIARQLDLIKGNLKP